MRVGSIALGHVWSSLVIALVLLHAPASSAGVAIVNGREIGAVFLREGPWLFRTRCPDDATTPDAATCQLSRQRIEALDAYRELDKLISGNLPALDRDLAAAQARALEVGVRLDEYLDVDVVSPDVTRIRAQIAEVETEMAMSQATIRGLRDQIARIEARAATGGAIPPDLPKQLALLRRQETDAIARDATMATRLDDLRTELLRVQVVSHSQAAFDLLRAQRQRHVDRAREIRAEANALLERRGRLAQFLAEIVDDQSFVFEVTPGAPFMDEARFLDGNFAEIQKAVGIVASSDESFGVRLVVPSRVEFDPRVPRYTEYDSEIVWMACAFNPFFRIGTGGSCPGLHIFPPIQDHDATFRERISVFGRSFFTSEDNPSEDFADWIGRQRDMSGSWDVHLICGNGRIDVPAGLGRCEAKIRYVAR